MTKQAKLDEFSSPEDRHEETFTKTIIFDFKPLTQRKQSRIDAAIESAAAIQAEAARRFPSVPKRRWPTAKPKNSTWYNWAKSMDSHLSNKTVHENIQRVREAFASWQGNNYDGERPSVDRFAEGDRCAFYYAQPRFKRYNGTYYVSLPLAAGRGERELLPIQDGHYLREYVDDLLDADVKKGRAEVIRKDGNYRLHQAIRSEVEVISDPKTRVGVDIGLVNLAAGGTVTADHEKRGAHLWSGAQAAEMRNRYAERKRGAQSESAYEDIDDAEQRFIEAECHRISRSVVDWATRFDAPGIVLEDLTDIRESFIRRKRDYTSDTRRALHLWPFGKLQDMIEYKALELGLPTNFIEPEYTSQSCNECDHVDEDNRSEIHFECQECGYCVNADVNAAFNIATHPEL